MSEPQFDDKFISVDEAERVVIETGQWRGTTVEFSNDGTTWTDAWLPSDDHPHPRLCRATVTREGVTIPTVVVASWDEVYPDDDPAAALWWDKKKTVMFSKVARVAAYRQAFRDVIGKRYERAEFDLMNAPAKQERDWLAELNAAGHTPTTLGALYGEALAAKAFVNNDVLQESFVAVVAKAQEAQRAAAVPKPRPPRQRQRSGHGRPRPQQAARSA